MLLKRYFKWTLVKTLRISLKFVISFIFTVVFCEYLYYFIVIYKCYWPILQNEDNPPGTRPTDYIRAIAIADTHLLGRRNGHWFDKLRREWQMYRAFQTTLHLHKPDLVIFLGDLFDEGKWCNNEEFNQYIQRFHSLFSLPLQTDVLIAAGNHDMGFHYSINPYLSQRFEEAFKAPSVYTRTIKNVTFITINSMAMQGDDCFLCKPARLKVEEISKKLWCAKGFIDSCLGLQEPEIYSDPILIQHYPLYRESDAICSEPDEAPAEEKSLRFRENWECLSEESSDMLLRLLEPRLVLSGHTHHGCRVFHQVTTELPDGRTQKRSVLEYTVPSFSWRNKKNPTFAMLTISKDEFAIYKCAMPDENTIYTIYASAFIFFIICNLRKKFQLSNCMYYRCKEKL